MMSKCILIFSNYKDITNDFRKFENTDKHKKKRNWSSIKPSLLLLLLLSRFSRVRLCAAP